MNAVKSLISKTNLLHFLHQDFATSPLTFVHQTPPMLENKIAESTTADLRRKQGQST